MKLHDNEKSVEIRMMNWTGNGYTPDWSEDFFEAGGLEYDEDSDSYQVDSVDYCIEQAQDWQQGIGDYQVCAQDYIFRNPETGKNCTLEEAEEKMREDLENRMVDMDEL